jgi:hypothetical protein
LLLVLDSNEYIFAFGVSIDPTPRLLLKRILDEYPLYSIRLPRLITDEVRRNLAPESSRNFMTFVTGLAEIDEDFVVPFDLGSKYEAFGFKEADAFISAYAEWVGADALVTENRHFLKRTDNLPFLVVTAEECLRLMNLPRG